MEQIVTNLEVRNILPDENQPRKYFPADKMYSLKQSVKKHGIKQPLIVEDMGNGKYLLIDGERRFRTAVDLGLSTVPCIVEAPKTEEDRLIMQFSIQEQHEAWTPVEKAMALLALSKTMSLSLEAVCKMLDITNAVSSRYVAFAELSDKESFVKNEVPLDYAAYFKKLKNVVRQISTDVLEQEFTRSDEKKMEHQLTKLIVRGDITKRTDLTKLSDSFKKKPELIEKFMTRENITPTSLYLESKAQGTHHLRNAANLARQLSGHIKAFMEIRDVKLSISDLETFKRTEMALKEIIGVA